MTEPVKLVRRRTAATAPETVPAQYTEDKLADRFAEQHAN